MKKIIFTALFLLAAWMLWPKKVQSKFHNDIKSTMAKNVESSKSFQKQALDEIEVAQATRGPSNTPTKEIQSLESMGKTLGQVTESSFTLKRLLNELQKTGQQPLVARDANPDTGEMMIVRTKSPLPGTRYFHAQYFTGEDGERFVQHMSFEYKPGLHSMEEAVAAVQRSFPQLSQPVVQREDYVKWTLDHNYILWVKRMSLDELKHDPFNSYSIADAGTIRVAVELEVHSN